MLQVYSQLGHNGKNICKQLLSYSKCQKLQSVLFAGDSTNPSHVHQFGNNNKPISKLQKKMLSCSENAMRTSN